MKKSAIALSLFVLLTGCKYWEVDKCLDRGGRWDQEKEQCQFK